MIRLRPTPALVSLAFLLGAAPAAADPQRPIREDLEFARGLASKWQFVELAESVLADIDASTASDRLKEEISLASCEVYASGARRERDDARREELFDAALKAYQDYLDENRFAENKGEAERALVDLASIYGQDLYRRFGEAFGAEAERLRSKIQSVLDDAIERTADLADDLELEIEDERNAGGSVTALQNQRFALQLNRGLMYLTLARTADDGTYFFSQAESTFEDVAGEAGEQSGFGLNAYIFLGETYAAQGRYVDAADFIDYVVSFAIPLDEGDLEKFRDLAPAAKEARWEFVDKATGPLVDAYLASGDVEAACQRGLHFQNLIDRFGFQVTRPLGYASMLSVARALIGSGGYVGGEPGGYTWYEDRESMESAHKGRRDRRSALDLALKMAQQVNRENRGNTLQLAAQKVIGEVIARGVSVDPEVLFEAAQGAYFEGEYTSAIDGFKEVLSVLEAGDDATRTRLGPEVFWHIGRSFQKSSRMVEAAVAFRTGLDDRWKGDPKFDAENAKRYHETMKALRSRAGEDPLVESMFRESQDLVIANPVGGNAANSGDILYSQAELAFNQKDYEDARAKFLEVPGSANNYEKAIVYAAVCLKRQGDEGPAKEELQGYLQVFVKDPVKTPTTESGKAARQEAKGLATYNLGHIQFEEAESGDGEHGAVVETLGSYTDDYPNQPMFGARASLMVLTSLIQEGEIERAEQRLQTMQGLFPTDASTAIGAYNLYKVFADRREQALAADGDADVGTLTRKMAENLAVFNDLASKPSLGNLRIEAGLWEELGEWPRVETVLARGMNEFPDDDAIDTSVRPGLAHAMLKQRKVRQAAELLKPLFEREDFKPSKQAARDFSLAMAGWVELDGNEYVEVPGIGDAAEIETAAKLLVTLNDSYDSWTCEWYRMKFEVAYAYYRWGQLDGKKLATAKNVIETLQADMSPGFGEMASACGDDVLQRQFKWLARKL